MLPRGIAAACLLPAALVHGAATIVVNTGTDHAVGAGECSGAANDCSLRQAIDKAASGDTVQIPSSVPTNNVTLGQIVIAKNLAITGAGSGTTTIDGHLASGLFNTTGQRTVSLTGITFARGFNQQGSVVQYDGGQITVDDARFVNTTSGGSNAPGGGVFYGAPTTPTTISISNSLFSSNAVGGGGTSGTALGLVSASGSGDVTVTANKVTFSNNQLGGAGA